MEEVSFSPSIRTTMMEMTMSAAKRRGDPSFLTCSAAIMMNEVVASDTMINDKALKELSD